jgi:hypothetical protein
MIRIGRLTAAALFLGGALLAPGTADAGPYWDWLCGKCPPPSYCPARYWAPTVARTYDCIHGPHLSVYAPDRHPEIEPTMAILKFQCPSAPPSATIYEVPTPPATSRFQYFDRPGGADGAGETTDKKP